MRKFIRIILGFMAKKSISRRCQMSIGVGAVVLYREFYDRPPSCLTIGSGSIFQACIASDKIGSTVVVGRNSFVGGSKLVCAERIEIGDDVMVSWGCTIVDHNSHSLYWSLRQNDVVDTHLGEKDWANVVIKPVKIENRAWVGFDVAILPGVTIGEGAVVGARSVVTKDVAPYTVVAGNPARFIRNISVKP